MRAGFGLLLITGLSLAAQDLTIGRGINLYSIDKEKSLGGQFAADILKTTTPLNSDVVLAYVRYVGARLAAQLPQPLVFPYNFALISQPETAAPAEPMSVPGGYIFVPAGLILTARDEAELAGALAHAMAHVAARHATRTASRGEIADLAAVPLGQGARPTLAPAAFVRFQMGFESEADVLAVNMAARAGYDPQGLERYLGRTASADNARLQQIQRAVSDLPQRTYSSSQDFALIQDEVRKAAPPAPATAK